MNQPRSPRQCVLPSGRGRPVASKATISAPVSITSRISASPGVMYGSKPEYSRLMRPMIGRRTRARDGAQVGDALDAHADRAALLRGLCHRRDEGGIVDRRAAPSLNGDDQAAAQRIERTHSRSSHDVEAKLAIGKQQRAGGRRVSRRNDPRARDALEHCSRARVREIRRRRRRRRPARSPARIRASPPRRPAPRAGPRRRRRVRAAAIERIAAGANAATRSREGSPA